MTAFYQNDHTSQNQIIYIDNLDERERFINMLNNMYCRNNNCWVNNSITERTLIWRHGDGKFFIVNETVVSRVDMINYLKILGITILLFDSVSGNGQSFYRELAAQGFVELGEII